MNLHVKVPSHSLDADVLVVGAGPVGLLLANLLGQAGMETLLLEKRIGETAPSMAIGIIAALVWWIYKNA